MERNSILPTIFPKTFIHIVTYPPNSFVLANKPREEVLVAAQYPYQFKILHLFYLFHSRSPKIFRCRCCHFADCLYLNKSYRVIMECPFSCVHPELNMCVSWRSVANFQVELLENDQVIDTSKNSRLPHIHLPCILQLAQIMSVKEICFKYDLKRRMDICLNHGLILKPEIFLWASLH